MAERWRKEAARRGYWYRRTKKLASNLQYTNKTLECENKTLKFKYQTILLNLNFYFRKGKAAGQREYYSALQEAETENEQLDDKIQKLEHENKSLVGKIQDVERLLQKATFHISKIPTTPATKFMSTKQVPELTTREAEIKRLEDILKELKRNTPPKKRKRRKKKN